MEREKNKVAATKLGHRHRQREILRVSQAPEQVTNLNYRACNNVEFKRRKPLWTVTSKPDSPMRTEELRSWSCL